MRQAEYYISGEQGIIIV